MSPSKDTLTVETEVVDAAAVGRVKKPLPLTVILSPTVPLNGDTVILGFDTCAHSRPGWPMTTPMARTKKARGIKSCLT
jgi:hypothetical protein